jgi:XTP/dITP diphosphohydrolase
MESAVTKHHTRESQLQAFGQLLDVMDQLRTGCPWDREQTNESLRPMTIEETYELSEAILQDDPAAISKELGDLLLHIVFYARIGSEKHQFDIQDVCEQLIYKLKYRHPHIFGEVSVSGSREVEQNWEKLKLNEKDGNRSVLSGVPDSLPSLIKAYRMQDKARGMGFDWEEKEQVWEKVKEEWEELQHEIDHMNHERMEAEFGDLFFSLINAARLYHINPDNALEVTNKKFRERFGYLESKTIAEGKSLHDLSLNEMDTLWEEAKAHENER